MPHNRYFVPHPLISSEPLAIEGTEAHHLLQVMRARIGDEIEVIDGQGTLALCHLVQIEKKRAIATIHTLSTEPPAKRPITLALALSRPAHLEWAIEKSTELGVSSLWLFPGALSEKKELSPSQQERLSHLCIAAAKQSGRLYLPSITYKPSIAKWDLSSECSAYRTFICDPDPKAPYLFEVDLSASNAPLLLFIGPEKGLSAQEKERLSQQSNATPVRLHPNILRAETAPLVALSLLTLYQK